MRDRCIFYFTSFGPFGDIKTNPTELIADKLFDDIFDDEIVIGKNNLEVSMNYVKDSLFDIHMLTNGHCRPSDIPIIIHFGVSGSASKILLEQFSYNCADFSIPDVNGEQPRNQKIIPDGPLTCETNVPVFDVVKSLNEPNLFEVSADPGRFVCNYTYYLSSQLAKTSSNPNMTVLFVHIPPFSKLSQEICQSACLRLCLTVANAMRHKYPTELSMYNFMNKALKGSILSKIFLQSSERAVSFASPSASPSRSVISSPNRARPLIHAETNTDNHNSEECMKIVKIPLSHLPSDHPGCLMRCCHGKCTSKVVADLNNSLDNNTSVVYDKAPSPFVNSILYDTPPVEDIYASACLDAIQTELSESWLDAGEHNDQVTSCLDDVKMNNDDFAPAAVPINTEKCLCGCEGDVSEVRNERKMIPAMKSLTTDTHHVSVGTEHIEKRTKSVSTSSNPMVDQQTSTNLCVTPPSSVRYRTL